jgi:hypothetical protein
MRRSDESCGGLHFNSMDRAATITRHIGRWPGAQERCRVGYAHVWLPLLVALAFLLGSPLLSGAHLDSPAPYSVDQPSPCESDASHPRLPSAHPVSPAGPGSPLIIMVFVLMAAAVARGLRKWPRTAAIGLVLAMGTFVFATAVHSVHHLSEPERAAECPVLSAAQHVPGALDAPCDISSLLLPAATESFVGNGAAPLSVPSLGPNQPRAPPSFPA